MSSSLVSFNKKGAFEAPALAEHTHLLASGSRSFFTVQFTPENRKHVTKLVLCMAPTTISPVPISATPISVHLPHSADRCGRTRPFLGPLFSAEMTQMRCAIPLGTFCIAALLQELARHEKWGFSCRCQKWHALRNQQSLFPQALMSLQSVLFQFLKSF